MLRAKRGRKKATKGDTWKKKRKNKKKQKQYEKCKPKK